MADEPIAGAPTGGIARVTHTGIALVHEGELIVPAQGSEAQADQVAEDERTIVQYYFPVEIEVRDSSGAADPDAVAELVLRRLTKGLESV